MTARTLTTGESKHRSERAREVLRRMGRTIAGKRIQKGLRQHELAQRVQLSTSYICMIERGLREPMLDVVLALARTFQCSPAEFYDFTTRKHG